MKSEYQVIKRPLLSEKGTELQGKNNQVLFAVDPRANKAEIKQAVEKLFKVKVTDVHTMRYRGKVKTRGRIVGQRPNWKKAVVTLAEGQTIQIFEGV